MMTPIWIDRKPESGNDRQRFQRFADRAKIALISDSAARQASGPNSPIPDVLMKSLNCLGIDGVFSSVLRKSKKVTDFRRSEGLVGTVESPDLRSLSA